MYSAKLVIRTCHLSTYDTCNDVQVDQLVVEGSTPAAAQQQEAVLAMAKVLLGTLSLLLGTPTTSTRPVMRAPPTEPLTLALAAATLAGMQRGLSMTLLVVQLMTGATLRRLWMQSSRAAKLAHTQSDVIEVKASLHAHVPSYLC